MIRSSKPSFLLAEQTPFLQPLLMAPVLQPSRWLGGPPWPSLGCQCLSKWGISKETWCSGCGRVKSSHPLMCWTHLCRHSPGQGLPSLLLWGSCWLVFILLFTSTSKATPEQMRSQPWLLLGFISSHAQNFTLIFAKAHALTQSSSLLCSLFLRRFLSLLCLPLLLAPCYTQAWRLYFQFHHSNHLCRYWILCAFTLDT